MSNPKPNPNPSPRGLNAGVKPKFYVWVEGLGVFGETESPRKYLEEWVEENLDSSVMEDFLRLVFPWREIRRIERIHHDMKKVETEVSYVYVEDDVEREGKVYISYDLYETSEDAGYWRKMVEELEKEGIPRSKITRAWRLEQTIYEIKNGRRIYYEDPSTVVILEVIDE